MKRKDKEKVVKELEDKFARCSSFVFIEFRGLNVQRMENLRKLSRVAHIELLVIKNTLGKMAYKTSNNKNDVSCLFTGPTALVFAWDDPITPVRVLYEFAKDNPEIVLKGGVIEGAMVNEDKIAVLANLPSREVLLGQVISGIQSPLRGVVNVLIAPITGLMNCLKAIEQKKA
ncbi:50S ribosomal protein L10 [bacterium]|nr:50S ribosomal protein L10 [bacterium]